MSQQQTPGHRTLPLSWPMIEADCHVLRAKIPERIKYIVPILRGGLVPATIISYLTGLPIPFTINVATPAYIRPSRVDDILILDEVCDSGETMRRISRSFHGALFAALYCKPAGRDSCHEFVSMIEQDCWLEFPWGQ